MRPNRRSSWRCVTPHFPRSTENPAEPAERTAAALPPAPSESLKPMASKKSDASPTKHYVLDTNVLIHDPQAMFQFEDNVVWIPVEVLEELDRFKAESTTRGANAREVHRRLNERFRNTSQMKAGVKLENGGQLHVCVNPNIQFDSKGHVQLLHESPRAALVLSLIHISEPTR